MQNKLFTSSVEAVPKNHIFEVDSFVSVDDESPSLLLSTLTVLDSIDIAKLEKKSQGPDGHFVALSPQGKILWVQHDPKTGTYYLKGAFD